MILYCSNLSQPKFLSHWPTQSPQLFILKNDIFSMSIPTLWPGLETRQNQISHANFNSFERCEIPLPFLPQFDAVCSWGNKGYIFCIYCYSVSYSSTSHFYFTSSTYLGKKLVSWFTFCVNKIPEVVIAELSIVYFGLW